MYQRVMAIVPIVGSGTFNDPRRPKYVPLPTAARPANGGGILGFSFLESDDGNFALVEFVAKDRSALQPILADPLITKFVKDNDNLAAVVTAFKKLRKDFDFNKFGRVVVQ